MAGVVEHCQSSAASSTHCWSSSAVRGLLRQWHGYLREQWSTTQPYMSWGVLPVSSIEALLAVDGSLNPKYSTVRRRHDEWWWCNGLVWQYPRL